MKKQNEKTYQSPVDQVIVNLAVKHFNPVKAMLDLGCGNGAHMRVFQVMGALAAGVTISENEKEEAVQYGPCEVYDLSNGIPCNLSGRNFNFVLAAHLLEHIFYPEKLMKDIFRVSEGNAIFVIPNILFWRNRLKMLFGIWQYQELGIMDYTHCRFYSFKGFCAFLKQYNYNLVETKATGGFFNNNNNLLRAINNILLRLFPGFFGFQFYYVTKGTGGIYVDR